MGKVAQKQMGINGTILEIFRHSLTFRGNISHHTGLKQRKIYFVQLFFISFSDCNKSYLSSPQIYTQGSIITTTVSFVSLLLLLSLCFNLKYSGHSFVLLKICTSGENVIFHFPYLTGHNNCTR